MTLIPDLERRMHHVEIEGIKVALRHAGNRVARGDWPSLHLDVATSWTDYSARLELLERATTVVTMGLPA